MGGEGKRANGWEWDAALADGAPLPRSFSTFLSFARKLESIGLGASFRRNFKWAPRNRRAPSTYRLHPPSFHFLRRNERTPCSFSTYGAAYIVHRAAWCACKRTRLYTNSSHGILFVVDFISSANQFQTPSSLHNTSR